MSLAGDEARFFHVISSKIVGGHATFQVRMVGKAGAVRTWDAKHMGYAFEAAYYDGVAEDNAAMGVGLPGSGAGAGAQGSDETNQRLERLRREQAGLDKLPAPELRRDFNSVDAATYSYAYGEGSTGCPSRRLQQCRFSAAARVSHDKASRNSKV
jgi:hypothetical protein